MNTYKVHPIAACYPPKPEPKYIELRDHIKANGLQNSIVLYEDQILDGVHRERACRELGIEPSYIRPEIKDPFEYVVGQNQRGRHLTEIQKIEIAANMANLGRGGDRGNQYTGGKDPGESLPNISREKAAKLQGVTLSSVNRFRRVEDAAPEILEAVRKGKITLSKGYDLSVTFPKEEQTEALKEGKSVYKNRPTAKAKAKAASGKNGSSPQDRQRQMLAEMRKIPSRGLTREQVDPDFKGGPVQFAAEYGHVHSFTKAERDLDRDKANFMTWVEALKDLERPLTQFLAVPPFSLERFTERVARSTRDHEKMAARFDMLRKAGQSIEQYRNILQK